MPLIEVAQNGKPFPDVNISHYQIFMKDEFTTAMHSEFTITPETARRHAALAALYLIARGMTPENAVRGMELPMTVEELKPYVPEWNKTATSARRIKLSVFN